MTTKRRIGVLALQGDFREHRHVLAGLGVEAPEVRRADELGELDALVIPGGESTTIGKLAAEYGLIGALRTRVADGMPVWGTCAGAIFIAKEVPGHADPLAAVMDITVERNAFGRQVDSFEVDLDVPALGPRPFHGIFIRAPKITRIGPGVERVATLDDGTVVAARQGALLATSFHPELTADARFHRYFLELVRGVTSRAAGLTDLRRVSMALASALQDEAAILASALPLPLATGSVGAWPDYLPQALGLGGRLKVFLDEEDGELRSVALVYDGHRPEWVVLALVGLGDAGSDAAFRLLSEISGAAARAGMQRLFAATPTTSHAQEPFFQAGFYSYTRESWLVSEGDVAAAVEPTGARAARAADAHDLFRFYVTTTPQAVQRAEQLSVSDFDVGRRAGMEDPPHLVAGNPLAMRRTASLLVPDDRGVRAIALAFAGRGEHPHVVKVRIAAGGVDLARGLLREAAGELPRGRPIAAPVRSHEEHVLRALVREGFSEVGAAMLFVKELAVRIEEPALAPAVVR